MTSDPRQGTPLPRRGRPLMPLVVCAALLLAAFIAIVMAGEQLRLVLAPLLTIAWCGVLYVSVLYRRDRQIPVFEVASLWMAAAMLYGGYPIVNFIAGGLAWHPQSNGRLIALDPGPAEVASLGWRYALWIGSFVVTYLIVRGNASVQTRSLRHPGNARIASIVLLFAGVMLFLSAISMVYGVDYSPSYRDVFSGTARSFVSLPLPLLRVTHNVLGMRLVLVWMVIALLLWKWKEPLFRALLFLFIFGFAAWTILRAGQRTELFLVLLATVILYHRLVRPFALVKVMATGLLFLAFFNAAGVVRNLMVIDMPFEVYDAPMFAEPNEFQAVFATAYDLKYRRDMMILPDVPLQIHFTEFVGLIPSFVLPFRKIDSGSWYLEILGLSGSGFGFMFGAVAQAIVGWDWPELALRGILLGLFCAFLHRWYARDPLSFWRTIVYLFLAMWMYYTARQASFAFLYPLVYRFVPTFLAVEGLRYLIASAVGRRRHHVPEPVYESSAVALEPRP